MHRYFLLTYILLGTSCVHQDVQRPRYELEESIFNFAIENHGSEKESIDYIFLDYNDKDIQKAVVSYFSKIDQRIFDSSESVASCDAGVEHISRTGSAIIISIIEINHINDSAVKVKWGFWENCSKYSYVNTKFRFESNSWVAGESECLTKTGC